MLEYRQNIKYTQAISPSLDDELKQLNELCKNGVQDYELYQKIRTYIFREIKIEQLAVTLILNDLKHIREYKPLHCQIIEYFIINNTASYKEIAEYFGCSKQAVHQLLTKYSKQFTWLENLLTIKGNEDAKNENNRTVFFQTKKKQKPIIQLSLIEQEVD